MKKSRFDFWLRPKSKSDESTPSIGRSFGTRLDSPTRLASVGSQSTAATISSVTPTGVLPGQRIIAGTRIPPSKPHENVPRHGPFDPPQDLASIAALSLDQITIVLSVTPALSSAASI